MNILYISIIRVVNIYTINSIIDNYVKVKRERGFKMRVYYIEGTLEDSKETITWQYFDNLYVRIGEKVKVRSKLCEVVDIVHYPEKYNEEDYTVEVFVKVIKQLRTP